MAQASRLDLSIFKHIACLHIISLKNSSTLMVQASRLDPYPQASRLPSYYLKKTSWLKPIAWTSLSSSILLAFTLSP